MKHKIKKEYIKTNLIGFIIAGIIVSGVVVYAAVTFPSNEVSYSNTESGLNSNNVQGAIDELYKICTQTLGSQILENNNLEKDPYECRYFFKGATPNNYITFNNETWRILSVECDGTIKIVKEASIGNMAWDTTNEVRWERPASLNTYLNGTYLASTLNSTAQKQIVSKDWGIGEITTHNNNLAGQIYAEKSETWTGKVALITVSEYIRSNSNQSNCGTFSQNESNSSSCKNTTWMQKSGPSQWWTLTPNKNSYFFVVFISEGNLNNSNVDMSAAVRPAVYLSSKIKITGGNGSSSSPYQISL